MYAVRVEHVSKQFPLGEIWQHVLSDVSLSIEEGKMTFIVGPSGCGKTTLISIISSLLHPTEGRVWVRNTEITQLSEAEKVIFRRHNIGFVFQDCLLIPTLTVAENIAIPLLAADVPFAEATARAKALLQEIQMERHADKLPGFLSGGEQQRIAICRALINDPYLLVCDEPTANLDSHTGNLILQLMKKFLYGKQRAILIVTHDNRIFSFADRIVSMSDGRIVEAKSRG